MFKCKFHQQRKFLRGKIRLSKINLVLLPWNFLFSMIIFLTNFVASNYLKVIADTWIILFYSFYIGLPFFWSPEPNPPKILHACMYKLACELFMFFTSKSILDVTFRKKGTCPCFVVTNHYVVEVYWLVMPRKVL